MCTGLEIIKGIILVYALIALTGTMYMMYKCTMQQ